MSMVKREGRTEFLAVYIWNGFAGDIHLMKGGFRNVELESLQSV